MDSHEALYDTIGRGYRHYRKPDHRIANQIRLAIGNASTVCNVGAGTGSYEPTDMNVTPVEPSRVMIMQRDDPSSVVQAVAEQMPFPDGAFDVSMAILTVHHWSDPIGGLREMKRISRRQVIMTFDTDVVDSFWLVRDYFPEITEFDKQRGLSIAKLRDALGTCSVFPVMVPWDCTDGFLTAYWRRPQAYLDSGVRNSISSFAHIQEDTKANAISRLANDIQTGRWSARNVELLDRTEMDFGYRLIVTNSP